MNASLVIGKMREAAIIMTAKVNLLADKRVAAPLANPRLARLLPSIESRTSESTLQQTCWQAKKRIRVNDLLQIPI